jgi:pimeloyl-ACP methyl ester carboxylesterase
MRSALALVVAAAALFAGPAAAEDSPKGEEVRFATDDGLSIAGTFYAGLSADGSPTPVVIALPMYRHTRDSWAPMVRPVTDRGMSLLAIDLRGHGDSAKQGAEDLSKRVADRDPELFKAMHADVEGAIAWLAKEKKTPAGKIGLLGASVGCSVAIDTAVRVPDAVGAVACLSPGRDYLGVPTMEHVAKWPKGKPLLLVSSDAEMDRGAAPISTRLEGRGAELKRVVASEPGKIRDAMDLHGTEMFGRVADVEDNVADWLAYRLAFRRVDLGGGVTAVVGSAGSSLYVGVETPEGSKTPLGALTVRVGLGPVTDPWSKSDTIEAGQRLDRPSPETPTRRRTRIGRERIGAEPGRPFAVALSLDGKSFVPDAASAPLFFALR